MKMAQLKKADQQKFLRLFSVFLTVGALLLGSACSSSGGVSDDFDDEESAELDEVPAEDTETAEVPNDLSSDEDSNELQSAAIEDEPLAVASNDPAAEMVQPSDLESEGSTELASVPPSSEVSPVPAASTALDSYSVQPGDTLMKIAFERYGDLYQWKRIRELNADRLGSDGALRVGTVLKLDQPDHSISIDRNGERYLIRLGDSLGTISGDVYGTMRKWKRLWENNRQLIKDPNKIFAGFTLYYTMTAQDIDEKARITEGQSLGSAGNQDSVEQTQRSPAQQ